VGGNINGFNTLNFNNEKGNDMHQFCQIFDMDAFFGQESNVDWDLIPYSSQLESMFHTKGALVTIAAHNKHRQIARCQYGGTFGLTFGELVTKLPETGVDETGLGRFAWMKFTGKQ
jgi:hypothetical protein